MFLKTGKSRSRTLHGHQGPQKSGTWSSPVLFTLLLSWPGPRYAAKPWWIGKAFFPQHKSSWKPSLLQQHSYLFTSQFVFTAEGHTCQASVSYFGNYNHDLQRNKGFKLLTSVFRHKPINLSHFDFLWVVIVSEKNNKTAFQNVFYKIFKEILIIFVFLLSKCENSLCLTLYSMTF